VVVNNNNNNNNNGAGGGSPWDAPFSYCPEPPFCGQPPPWGGWNCWGPWGPWNGEPAPPWCALCPTGATGDTGTTGSTGATLALPVAGGCENSVAASSLLPQWPVIRRRYRYHASLNPPTPGHLPQAQYISATPLPDEDEETQKEALIEGIEGTEEPPIESGTAD
jgi:hypothetical protein